MKRTKISREMKTRLAKKIRKLIREGYPQKQAIAIAYGYARKHKIGPRGGKKNPGVNWSIVSKLMNLGYSKKDAMWLAQKSKIENYLKKVKNPQDPKIIKEGSFLGVTYSILKITDTEYKPEYGVIVTSNKSSAPTVLYYGTIEPSKEKINEMISTYKKSFLYKARNPIPDDFLPQVIVVMMYLEKHPEKCNSIPDSLIEVLVEENLFNAEKCELTNKGKKFLIDARKLSRDEIE